MLNSIKAVGLILGLLSTVSTYTACANDTPEEFESLRSKAARAVVNSWAEDIAWSDDVDFSSSEGKLKLGKLYGKLLRVTPDEAQFLVPLFSTKTAVMLLIASGCQPKDRRLHPHVVSSLGEKYPSLLHFKPASKGSHKGPWAFCGMDESNEEVVFVDGPADMLLKAQDVPLRIYPREENEGVKSWTQDVFKAINESEISKLTLWHDITPEQSRALFKREGLKKLQHLKIALINDSDAIIPTHIDASMVVLANNCQLPSLKTLYLGTPISSETWFILMDVLLADNVPSLMSLKIDPRDLNRGSCPSKAIHRLAQGTGLTNLQELMIYRGQVSRSAAQALGDAGKTGRFPCLRKVVLNNCGIDHVTLQELLPLFGNVESLNLGHNKDIGNVGVIHLITSSWVNDLRTLVLSETGITHSILDPLLSCKKLHTLEYLHLSDNNLGGQSGRLLGEKLVHFPHLNRLLLLRVNLGQQGIIDLIKGPGLQTVEQLLLNGEDIPGRVPNAELCATLTNTPYLKNLRWLEFNNAHFPVDDLRVFLMSPNYPKLEQLGLHQTVKGFPNRAAYKRRLRECVEELRKANVKLAQIGQFWWGD